MRPKDLVDHEAEWTVDFDEVEPVVRLLRRASGMMTPLPRSGGPFCVVCLELADEWREFDFTKVALCEAHAGARTLDELWRLWREVVAQGGGEKHRAVV